MMTRIFRRRRFVIAVVAAVLGGWLAQVTSASADSASPAAHAKSSRGQFGPKGSPGVVSLVISPNGQLTSYSYVDGALTRAADGATAQLFQAQPVVASTAYHSLVELSVESADTRQIVEVGWTVDKALNGDSKPHLFVYHWVNGSPTCYNGCGFVPVSANAKPGMAVSVSATSTYTIQYFSGNWWVGYSGTWVGYFSGSLWNGAFTRAGLSQAFGEVASSGLGSCTMMGNGTYGVLPTAATVSQFKLINAAQPPLVPLVTDVAHYNQGIVSGTAFRLGGPGRC